MSPMELRVTVNRVYYPTAKKKSGEWHVLGTNAGKCAGDMHWTPAPREKLIMVGTWGVRKGEKQFRFTSVEADIPIDPRILLDYAGDLATGIGPSMLEDIWKHYGPSWRDRLEPRCLPRYTEALHEEMERVLKDLDLRKDRTVFVSWFASVGGEAKIGTGAWEEWGVQARAVITADPYDLTNIEGCGFRKVEKLRDYFGIEDHDPRRIRAAIRYFMDEAIKSGSTLLSYEWLVISIQEALGDAGAVVTDKLFEMIENDELAVYLGPNEITRMMHARREAEIYAFFGRSQPVGTSEVA